MSNSTLKLEYQKYKQKLKQWENEFKVKYSRLPSKHDIREAPAQIKISYKMYYKLKTSFLEDAFNNSFEIDDFHINSENLSQPIVETNESIESSMNEITNSSISESKSTITATYIEANTKSYQQNDYEAIKDTNINVNAWNIKDKSGISDKEDTSENVRKRNLKITDKLFNTSTNKFFKRNPRKSINTMKLNKNNTNVQMNSSVNDNKSLPDFNAILERKSLKYQLETNDVNTNTTTSDLTAQQLLNDIHKDWLNRCDDFTINNLNQEQQSTALSLDNVTSDTLTQSTNNFGLSNLKFKTTLNFDASSSGTSVTNTQNRSDAIDPAVSESDDEIIENSEDELNDSSNVRHQMYKKRKTIYQLNRTSVLNTTSSINHTINNQSRIHDRPKTNNTKEKIGNTPVTRTITNKNVPESDVKTNDYSIEYGIDTSKNISRANVNELKLNTKLFTNYLYDSKSDIEKKPSKVTATNDIQSESKMKLLKKIEAGTLNENFVKINIEKKKYVRGKKKFNFSKYKKKIWKKQKERALLDTRGCDGGFLICHQCGKPGHFQQNCKEKGDNLLPYDENAIDDSIHLTIDEVTNMIREKNNASQVHSNIVDNTDTAVTNENYIGHVIPDDFLQKISQQSQSNNSMNDGPIYKLTPDGHVIETPNEIFDTLKLFGHSKFRNGQEKAIMRVLSGLSTLVTLSTGSGKSLCYQIPAYIYRKKQKAITLVISPLVSLMEDQVHGVNPKYLVAACLHQNQTKIKQDQIIEKIKLDKIDILLVSPEAIVAGEKLTGFNSIFNILPKIGFAVIDEAHCVSQWSHNFRPSYLMICRILREKLHVNTILGLTATATINTRDSICEHLNILDTVNGIISNKPLPDNLLLTVSCDKNRDLALINLLTDEKFINYKSIIIYCSRREECERIAKLIRTRIPQDTTNETYGKKSFMSTVESYHAGMPASRRRSIQNNFMNDRLRIVVATIAFGMGINKPDIRAIIHYNMPANFESYVQEVGRSGRDGQLAHCHLFLNSEGKDKCELERHIYANTIDRYSIRKLLQNIFIACSCKEREVKNNDASTSDTSLIHCPGHEVGFSIESMVQNLDVPEENIATLLCYLELHEKRYIKVMSKAYTMCQVLSYKGSRELKLTAQKCPPLAMAIALDLKKGIDHNNSTNITFPVIDVAATIGWDSGIVKHQLKNTEWTTTDNGLPKRSKISVAFSDLGFRVRAPGNLSSQELDYTLDYLHSRVLNQERKQRYQINYIFDGLSSISYSNYKSCLDDQLIIEKSDRLKQLIRNYFNKTYADDDNNGNLEKEIKYDETQQNQIISDIRNLINAYPENNFTGRSIARIFHGVQSPVYPAVIWGRCKYWRAYISINFNYIVNVANVEIVKMRT